MTQTNEPLNPSTQDAPKTPIQEHYADRYYAQYDPHAPQPTPVLGWYDMWGYTSLEGLPPLSDLMPLSKEFWEQHLTQPQESCGISNGKIVAYTPPPPSLTDQAGAAMQNVQRQAAMVTAMGETFGPQTRAYVQSLRAIINGSDTTSTTLPTAPDDVTT